MNPNDSLAVFLLKGFFKLIGALIILILILILGGLWGDFQYKQGQIDYANGVIKYELVEQQNTKQVWVEIEDVE